jgi:hypothetical protein
MLKTAQARGCYPPRSPVVIHPCASYVKWGRFGMGGRAMQGMPGAGRIARLWAKAVSNLGVNTRS